MIGFDEAARLVAEAAKPLGVETVPIEAAAGRVLARPVHARLDSPRSDVSAMDGYAVRESDLATLPASLQIVGESFAGSGWAGPIGGGQCARIFTGAPVPAGGDRVVIQEDVERDGDTAIFRERPGAATHIRRRGSDFAKGDELLGAGQLLHPRALVAAAAADLSAVDVFVRPRTTILGTGDELSAPGMAAASEQSIPESVSFGVTAMIEAWGGAVVARHRLRDDLETMEHAAADAARSCDLVIVTGGASVGEKDLAKQMFGPALDLIFSKVAIKPGKPVWLGRCGGALVMGLPGNPTSALVTARLLLASLVAGLCGRPPEDALKWRELRLASPLGACGGRETFHRAKLAAGSAEILSFQDSSAQKALAQADLLVRQRAGAPGLEPGAMVEALDF